MDQWAGIVLAAGQGTRMKSRVPKVLHPLCGKPMLCYPVELLRDLGVQRIIVVVSPANRPAIEGLLGSSVVYAVQREPLGTGDAVSCALPMVGDGCSQLLALNGDVPLIRPESLRALVERHRERQNLMTLLTAEGVFAPDLGRVAREEAGQVTGIVEAQDSTGGEFFGAEVNVGAYCFQRAWLERELPSVQAGPTGEIYLTSLAALGTPAALGSLAAAIEGVPAQDPSEAFGVNDRVQLAIAENVLRERIREHWMMAGVTITDPSSVYIDADAAIGQDSVILPNTHLLGSTRIGRDCRIGPNTTISDSAVGDGCRVTASALEGAAVEDDVEIGPFSHLRPGAYLESNVHLGNFAEVKESRLGRGVLMGHFGYVGDASIGAGTNLGAGTITCNFDGKDKHRTEVGERAFVGCDTMLVAPVSVGTGAATGAGAVVTRDVPAGRLAVGVPAKLVESRSKSD